MQYENLSEKQNLDADSVLVGEEVIELELKQPYKSVFYFLKK